MLLEESLPNLIKRMQENGITLAISRVVLPYILFASLWILVSDAVVVYLWKDPEHIAVISTLKGWAFVLVTAILLSVLLRCLIVSRNLVETNLREKHAELERFIYTVSHDLKSPLITARTFLGYLEKDMASNDSGRIQQDLAYVLTATEKMDQLLGGLLKMSRVGRIVNPPTIVTLRDLVTEALDAVAGAVANRGVKVKIVGENITLYGDRPRMAEIWQNLLENAVKYMGEQADPLIEIGAQQEASKTVFFVRDNGIGLDPGDKEKIFGLFVKLEPSSEGSGFGLALAKQIVEFYQGSIWVESAGIGKGSTFFFTLPEALQGVKENRTGNKLSL
jgi:signal transduction histidine kinase